MSVQLKFIILAILLIFSSLFSGSEAALFSLRRWRLERLAKERYIWAKRSNKLLSNPWKLLTTILLGNDMVNIIISNLAADLRRQLLESYGSWAIFPAAISTLLIILLLGEILPKVIAVSYAEEFSKLTSSLVSSFSLIASPLTFPIVKILKRFSSLFRRMGHVPKTMEAEEIKALLRMCQKEGSLSASEVNAIEKILGFSHRPIRYVMEPRVFMHGLPLESKLEEAIEYIKKNRLSYVPVYRESYDDIIGILTAGNAVKAQLGLVENMTIKDALEQPLFFPQSLTIAELISQIGESSLGVALVVDEYGGIAGIVDRDLVFQRLMEQLAIPDRGIPSGIEKLVDGRYIVDAQIPIYKLSTFFEGEIDDRIANTLGGHVLNLFGYIPRKGESVAEEHFIYTVAEKKGNRLKKIIIKPIIKASEKRGDNGVKD